MNETNNTLLAREHILKHTDKQIKITTLHEMAKVSGISGIEGYLGAAKEYNDHIMVALNADIPESHENTFVHELLHIILDYEKFPNVVINEQFAIKNLLPQLYAQLPKLQAYFSSAIDHPEIYVRMKDNYELNMEKYFNSLLAQKKNRFTKNSFLNWYVNPEMPEEAINDFIEIGTTEQGLDKQKKLLTELLNKNQLYVNLSEIDDEDFKVSDEDKELNQLFYSGGI